jgi:hypothetical protein
LSGAWCCWWWCCFDEEDAEEEDDEEVDGRLLAPISNLFAVGTARFMMIVAISVFEFYKLFTATRRNS